jgi:tRNA nucleotidyltransferase (CCA-adding enzyme)
LERLAELDLLPVVDRDLALTDDVRECLREARAAHDWYRLEGIADPPVLAWRLLLMALAEGLENEGRERLARRLLLVGDDRRLLTGFSGRLGAALAVLNRAPRPHQVAEALEPLSGEELLLMMAAGNEEVRAWVRRDLTEFRGLALRLRGADLLAAGVPPGPQVGEALRAVRRARLDGAIAENDELGYALQRFTEVS